VILYPKGNQTLYLRTKKKPELGVKLIDLTLSRGYQLGIVIIDAGYGHNTSFLLKIENRN
jgi:SRSO17 transposase